MCFDSGLLFVSHVLAEIYDYNLSRVAFENAIVSIKIYYKLNKRFQFKCVKDTRRTQIETHDDVVDYDKPKKKRVMNDVYAGVATTELLTELLKAMRG